MIKTKYKKLLTSFIGGISQPPIFDKLVQWLNIVDGVSWLDGSGVREGVIQNTTINLNGTDNQIELQNTATDFNFEDGDFRIEYWVDLSTPSKSEYLISKYDATTNNRQWGISKRTNGEIWLITSSNGTSTLSLIINRISIPEAIGKIEIERISGVVKVYINDIEVAYIGSVVSNLFINNSTDITIGNIKNGGLNALGAFNRARIWCGKCDKTLDIIPIQESGNTSTNVYDHSGNGYHGILSGTINASTRTNYISADIPVYANELGYNNGVGEIIPPDPINAGFDVLGDPLDISGKVNYNAVNNVTDMVQLLSPNVFALDSLHDTPFFYSTDGTPLTKILPSDFDFINYEAKNILFVKKDEGGNVVEIGVYDGTLTGEEADEVTKYFDIFFF